MQNIKMINDYMRKKEEGLNMSEMIHAHLENIKDKDAAAMVELIDDAFFQEETVKGLTFQVRRSNFMRGHRTLNRTLRACASAGIEDSTRAAQRR
jgi:hypothetical protein